MNWNHADFAERLGLGTNRRTAFGGRPRPVLIGRADIDPLTRGMMAALSEATLDGAGGAGDIALTYWYRRQNGQSRTIHLFEVRTETRDDEIAIDEIFYRNKPLLSGLQDGEREAAEEILLDALREVNLHLREGGSPRDLLKILRDHNVGDIIGEGLALPGQDAEGRFNFHIADTFNSAAQGKLIVTNHDILPELIALGEVNTLDRHRHLDGGARSVFGSNPVTGTTFRTDFSIEKNNGKIETRAAIHPARVPSGERASSIDDLLTSVWRRRASRANDNGGLTLDAMRFMGADLKHEDTDTRIRALGVFYRMMDMARRRRYPTALDFIHEFDLLDMAGPSAPPPPEGRFSLYSYLGNGKEETIEGFGFDLGACKIPIVEWWDQNGDLRRELLCFDVGKLLAPPGSQWDGGLPDLARLKPPPRAIFISHRHLDHMAALIELTRLGLLKNVEIYAAPRVLYILQQQIKADLDDKTLLPLFKPLQKEGLIHFERFSVEYCVDGMDHSTPGTIYRAVARKTDRTDNLTAADLWGSYLFYGDGRTISKPEFLSRGLRSFGVERQDTLFDIDITNAKRPGYAPTEADAERNLTALMTCFKEFGFLVSIISTNDRRLKTLYRVFNRVGRNFTAVGHNIEMSLRAHNIHGVDPEYDQVFDKDNVNKFLAEDAAAETERRRAPLSLRLALETDPDRRRALEAQIEAESLPPVEFRSRGSARAKSWLQQDLGKLAILATGTQGNAAERFSTMMRFAEGWSTLDADRHTAYRVNRPDQWIPLIDQSAIVGNHNAQQSMIFKLCANRAVAGVIVAIDDGIKLYRFDPALRQRAIAALTREGRAHYIDNDDSLCLTGMPIHPSGHGYRRNIADMIAAANADWNHGTHSNDPENTRALQEICAARPLRHPGRQFDDHERIGIDMGASPAAAKVWSLGHENRSIIVYQLIRELGDFFGGTLRAKRITKFDGRTGYAEQGIMAARRDGAFADNVVTLDFNTAVASRRKDPVDKATPDEFAGAPPPEERRNRGVTMPGGVRIDDRKREKIRLLATLRTDAA